MRADYPQMTYRKHTFFSSLVSGLSVILVTLIICVTVIIIYGMNMAGEKSEEIISLAQSTIHGLPAIQSSLPPVLADILNDSREPDYMDQVEITAEPSLLSQNNNLGAAVMIVNKGQKVISLMSLRVTILNSKNEALTELNEWVATPVTGKNDWPGPLMPDSKRYFSAEGKRGFNIQNMSDLKAEVEITDLRVWNGDKPYQPEEVNEPVMTEEPG